MKFVLQGTLKSMRDKSLNKNKKAEHNSRLIRAEQEMWIVKLYSCEAAPFVRSIYNQCASNKVKLKIEVVVYRHKPILDYKNIVGGFDHAILDGWVNAGLIQNDNTGFLDWSIRQLSCERDKDCIEIELGLSDQECSNQMRKI